MISKQFLLSAIGSAAVAFVFLGIAVSMWIRGKTVWEVISQVLFSMVLLSVSGLLFYKAYRTKDPDYSNFLTGYKDIKPFTRFIIHPEVHAFNQLIIYNEAGNMVGRLLPGESWLRHLEPLLNLLPFKHYIESEDGHLLTLDIRGFFNQKTVVFNDAGKKVGTIRQNFFKSLFKFQALIEIGEDKYETQSDVLFGELEVSNIVKITSLNVPVEHIKRFKRLSERMYIIEKDLETDEGKVGLAVLCLYASVARGK